MLLLIDLCKWIVVLSKNPHRPAVLVCRGWGRCWVTRRAHIYFVHPSLPPSENDSLYSEAAAAAAAELTFCFLSSSLFSNLFCLLHSAPLCPLAYLESLRSSTTRVRSARVDSRTPSRAAATILAILVGVVIGLEKCLLMFWRSVEDFRVLLPLGTRTHARGGMTA